MLQINKRYVVTKDSSDQTLREGDRIKLDSDGCLICIDAEGWIEPGEVAKVLLGAEYELDVEWIERKKKELQMELNSLSDS